jgi:pimeloyl-ACP methyl ester carboxylesterase
VHVLWGREDPVTPVAQADHLPPGFSVHRLDDVGHMPMLEAPADLRRLDPRCAGAVETAGWSLIGVAGFFRLGKAV